MISLTADQLLAEARKWTQPKTGGRGSKHTYAVVDPTIDLLASKGWSGVAIKDSLLRAGWPKSKAGALYHHIVRRLRK